MVTLWSSQSSALKIPQTKGLLSDPHKAPLWKSKPHKIKKASFMILLAFDLFVTQGGFEPPTLRAEIWYSIQLNYWAFASANVLTFTRIVSQLAQAFFDNLCNKLSICFTSQLFVCHTHDLTHIFHRCRTYRLNDLVNNFLHLLRRKLLR